MKTYAILRRAAWGSADELAVAAELSAHVAEAMHDEVRWIRTYVIDEPRDQLGAICIYEATSPEAIREHAAAVGMPADEIIAVTQTVVLHADPTVARP